MAFQYLTNVPLEQARRAYREALLQQGYTFVPISELILPGEYNTDYTIDHTGKQCPCQ